MGRLRHLNTRGIFARESSKHFKPLHVIAADPLHCFFLGIGEMVMSLIGIILTPSLKDKFDGVLGDMGIRMRFSNMWRTATDYKSLLSTCVLCLCCVRNSEERLSRNFSFLAAPPSAQRIPPPVVQGNYDPIEEMEERGRAWISFVRELRWRDFLAALSLTNIYIGMALRARTEAECRTVVSYMRVTRLVLVPLAILGGVVSERGVKVKLHMMAHIDQFVKLHGMLSNVDTQTGERMNSSVLKAYRHLRFQKRKHELASETLPFLAKQSSVLFSKRETVIRSMWHIANDKLIVVEKTEGDYAVGKIFELHRPISIVSPIVGTITLYYLYEYKEDGEIPLDELIEKAIGIGGGEVDCSYEGYLAVCIRI
ncbi:hypothetical protein ADUPG1_012590 [Aduncisulcus paluster]|uniref:Uncharacterized protein n=1 Tax=Aduncisulcus paluster TaxID=2918883 RepID=A0ABQ5K0Q1_9EUKA|nr:hypothetical protein ADUPG1_012590 [Aduncisulcus paluster]